ncbi:hypothetical protein BDA99DRAFT_554835 [Phascolomyces articulosus]|uniref:NAD(P)-binding protein n=1 Tax=Phascolomyces articulosus TaxID=60185 RepID=A0AAD5KAQ0_9FUNG|nr:hypothetical protein BDA99DRAFT_554835 [Phascolomyces articulosus]
MSRITAIKKKEKTIFISGGSSGLGREAVKQFLSENHTVVFTGRSIERIQETITWVNPSQDERQRLYGIVLDLESLTSIRETVKTFKSLGISSLDVLLNNAARTTVNLEYVAETTKVEKTIFANTIGPWYLTLLLIPSLHPGSRILFVTSELHNPKTNAPMSSAMSTKEIQDPDLFDKLNGKGQPYSALPYYSISKLADVWITYLFAKKFPDFSVNTFCPGLVPTTGLNRQQSWLFLAFFRYILSRFPGAITEHQSVTEYMYYATSDELEGVTGTYFTHGKQSESSERSKNMEEAARFWNLACEICSTPEHTITTPL